MSFPPSFIEQLQSRITLSELIGKQVRLVHKTGGSYSGLCPFHQEKTPSFTVNNIKGFYHCFGCSAHGDAISFLMKKEGLSFTESITRLAEQVGLPLPQVTLGKREQEQQQKIASAYEVMEQACKWFEQQLLLPIGKEAIGYFQQRGISGEARAKFRLGFAPDGRHALERALKEKGISEAQLLEVGLIGKTEQGECYDRFRGRVMFPILDSRNRVIAFGGRIIREGNPKYLNSPETMLFKKGEVLYAEHLARKPAHEQGRMVVVEGYMDVIALHMAGITTAVAPLGTALTEQHLQRLWRYVKEPVICLDGDAAGKRAMLRTAVLALPLLKPGVSLRFVELPPGEDPDEAVKRGGAALMERLLASALPLSEMLWNNEYSKEQLTTPEQKAAFEQRMMQYAETIADTQVQGYYRRYFSSKIWENVKRFSAYNKEKGAMSSGSAIVIPEKQAVIDRCESTIMAVILHYPVLLKSEEVETAFIAIDFKRSDLDKLRTVILELQYEWAGAGANLVDNAALAKDFRQHLEKNGFADNINYLCGNPGFLPHIIIQQKEDIHLLWHYALSKYHLALMREEYKAVLAEMTEEAERKAREYYNQIIALEKNIFEKEQLLLNRD